MELDSEGFTNKKHIRKEGDTQSIPQAMEKKKTSPSSLQTTLLRTHRNINTHSKEIGRAGRDAKEGCYCPGSAPN